MHIRNNIILYPNAELQQKVDKALIERAQFLDDLFSAKKVILQSILKLYRKSQNLDSLQKTLKTLSDLENIGSETEKEPGKLAGTVNMFQFINQKLIDEGYVGSELTDADIVKRD